jgi:catechol 2,3-dioxygenase-like lactoylglutathione lyase family enzyme
MMRFGDVAVVVSDARKSLRWYTEKLGFEMRSDAGHWVKGASVVLHLCEGEVLEPGNTGIGFTAADVAKEERELRSRGVEFTEPTTKRDWGTYAMFKDPDGNEFWISDE